MSKYELIKSIEGQRLNPRTGIPTTDPPVSIPFGGIIQDITPDRDMDKFVYLGQRYQCPHDILESAIAPIGAPHAQTTAAVQEPAPAATSEAPREAQAAAAAPAPANGPKLVWEPLDSSRACSRAKVPGGWLICTDAALAFYPDSKHSWDGASLP